jgi:hypothetical protein
MIDAELLAAIGAGIDQLIARHLALDLGRNVSCPNVSAEDVAELLRRFHAARDAGDESAPIAEGRLQ